MNAKKNIESTKEVIESWVKLYTDILFKWALYKTSDKETAEDLVQDTFLAAYQQIEVFEGKSSPKTWLLAILNNKIRSYYRAKYKALATKKTVDVEDNQLFSSIFNENDHWKSEEKPIDWEDNQTNLLDDADFNHVLASCLGHLPEQWRLALNFKYMEEKKGKLICQELEISTTNFWQILHRAKLKLRKCLELNWFKL